MGDYQHFDTYTVHSGTDRTASRLPPRWLMIIAVKLPHPLIPMTQGPNLFLFPTLSYSSLFFPFLSSPFLFSLLPFLTHHSFPPLLSSTLPPFLLSLLLLSSSSSLLFLLFSPLFPPPPFSPLSSSPLFSFPPLSLLSSHFLSHPLVFPPVLLLVARCGYCADTGITSGRQQLCTDRPSSEVLPLTVPLPQVKFHAWQSILLSGTWTVFVLTPAWVSPSSHAIHPLYSIALTRRQQIGDILLGVFRGFGGFFLPIFVVVYMFLIAPVIFFSIRFAALGEKKVLVPPFGQIARRWAGD